MKKALFLLMMFYGVAIADSTPVTFSFDDTTPSIQRYQVVWMYQMKVRYWNDGTKITVYNLPLDSRIHKEFVRRVLQISPITYQQSIDRLINSGNASNYKTVSNETQMYNEISRNPGSIGYIGNNLLLVSSGGNVREITIID